MKSWFALSFSLVLSVSNAAIVDGTATVKKQIQADFNQAMAALKNQDIKGFMTFTADDYQGNDQGMKVNKAYVEQTLQMYKGDANKINSYSFDIKNLKVSGKKATGRAIFKLDSTMLDSQGMMGEKGKTHRMTYAQVFATTWMKSAGHWQRSKETSVGQPKMSMDGKPFNPGGQPTSAQKPTKVMR